MSTAIVPALSLGAKIEGVLVQGDLSKLTAEERVAYYRKMCQSLGLNPLTRPLEYIVLSGKLTLYARKDATEQLRKLHGVSIVDVASVRLEDVFVVTAKATDQAGRTDVATGAVALTGLRGEALANALMKAETKAKRRVTLSICGLGMLDESELETVEAAPLRQEPTPPDRPAPVITREQQKLLFARAKEAGWATEPLKAWLRTRGFTSTTAIRQDQFDELLRALDSAAAHSDLAASDPDPDAGA